VDTPDGIYARPASLFVAEFVGAPAMNLLPVSLVPSGSGVACVLASGLAAARVRPRSDVSPSEGVLGIRPRYVEWQPLASDAGSGWLPGVIEEIDDTGDDTLIFANVRGESIRILESRGRRPAVGDAISVRFPEQAVHLFIAGKRMATEAAQQPADVA
jgi:ABC-type sugar transport system ATPase subunit